MIDPKGWMKSGLDNLTIENHNPENSGSLGLYGEEVGVKS